MRAGIGFDTHRLEAGRRLMLGGVEIEESDAGLAGHSDADSLDLLRAVRTQLADVGYSPANIDATVVGEEPKLGPFRDEMRTRLADAAGLDRDAVNVKFTTGERMGFVGRGEGMAALAIATLRPLE